MEISKSNILIAEFLEWKPGILGEWTCLLDKPNKEGFVKIYFPDGSDMKFHTDWNWLMLACQKWDLLSTVNRDVDCKRYVELCEQLDHFVTLYDIKPVFDQLVTNIKWYNKYKLKTK